MKKFLSTSPKVLLLLFIFCFCALSLSAESLRVVNAASLVSNTSLAPGSIITIFGENLAKGVASVSNPALPPNSLSGATVTVGGVIAPLFFVSPTQINAVLAASTPLGPQTLTVTSATGTFSTTITVDKAAPPGIFSLFGTGTRDGAIINAITFKLGAFSTKTGNVTTFLAIFATGLDLSTPPTVTIGGVPATIQFAGAAPCCVGLQQINIIIPDSLAGAGRVPVVLHSGGKSSNTVQVVILPNQGQGPFKNDHENETRSRELAGIASIPGTSLALVADENDDVVRVIDASKRAVTQTISLPSGSEPVAIAVDAAGKIAVVVERNKGKIAILDLTSFTVTGEVAVGLGPVAAAIVGTQAVVVNQDADSVSIVDLSAKSVLKTLTVGRGPAGVAIDVTAKKAFVTNENDGTVSVIDLAALSVSSTLTLAANLRVEAIQLIPNSNFAVITAPGNSKDGTVIILNVITGTFTQVNANPDRSGGSADVVVNGSTVFFANQTGGSVSVLPISNTGAASTVTTIKVDLGARALAIDTKDNLLLVSNEGSGTIVLVDLTSNKVVGRITAVRSDDEDDDGEDDHSDHDHAKNQPVVVSLNPITTKATATFTLTITGTSLAGATDVIFINSADIHGNGKGKGKGEDKGARDSAFVASGIQVNGTGTQISANIKVTNAALGPRLVRVMTPNGESAGTLAIANTITVLP